MHCPLSIALPPVIGLVAALAAIAVPAQATAAPPVGIDAAKNKRFRLHAGTDVFSFVHFNPDGAPNDANTNALGFGIGRRTTLDGTPLFLGAGVASLGFGGVILDGRALIGGAFAFTVDGLDVGDNGGTYVQGRFVPYFNWMFKPFGRVRPFIGAHFGLGGGAFTFEAEDPFDPGVQRRITNNVIFPVVGAQGGVHIFIVEHVSIDAMLNFDYIAPFVRTAVDGGNDPTNDEDFDKAGDLISIAFINVGLSAWF